jgi:hypothetical protein
MGTATIVAREQAGWSEWLPAHRSFAYHFVADVQPDSGAPVFRAEFTQPQEDIRMPEVGEQARVRFHPRSEKVELDKSELRNAREQAQELATERFEAIADAPPGSSPPGSAPPSAPAPVPDGQDTLADISATAGRLRAGTADLTETLAAIKSARAAGDLAEVDRLKAEFKRRSAASAPSSGQPVAGPAASAAASDPLERLRQLGELHASGVLTDTEFAAEKAKILAGT